MTDWYTQTRILILVIMLSINPITTFITKTRELNRKYLGNPIGPLSAKNVKH